MSIQLIFAQDWQELREREMQKMMTMIVSLEIIHLRASWCTLRHQVNWHSLIWNTIEIAQTLLFAPIWCMRVFSPFAHSNGGCIPSREWHYSNICGEAQVIAYLPLLPVNPITVGRWPDFGDNEKKTHSSLQYNRQFCYNGYKRMLAL